MKIKESLGKTNESKIQYTSLMLKSKAIKKLLEIIIMNK